MSVFAPTIISLAVSYATLCGLYGTERNAPRWLNWPLPVWNRIAHSWRKPNHGRRVPQAMSRAGEVHTAVLEHDLFGVQPPPGTAAALAVGMRGAGACLSHKPVADIDGSGPVSRGVCAGCGHAMTLSDSGHWEPTT